MEMCWRLKGGHKQNGDPASDNLVEIETVGSNVNLFDRSIFRSGGRDGADAARLYSMQTYKFSKDKQYIISTNLDLTIYNYALNLLSSNVSTSTVFQDTGWKSVQPLQFNYSSSDYYVGLIIKKKDNSAISLEEIADVWFKAEEGSVATPWSPLGMGSVKIDVVNNNLLNMNNLEEQLINGITYSIKNNVLKLRGTATANKTLIFNNKKEVNLKADTYTLSVNKSGTITGTFGYYIYPDSGSQIIDGGNLGNTNNTGTKTQILNNEYQNCKFGIFFAAGCVIDVTLKVQLENGSIARKFAEHQSQTAIMPVQQEMLNGDYIADIEHHEWEKLILTGDEDWHKSSTTEVDRFSYNTSEYPAFADGLSNYFLVQKGIGTNVGTLVFNAGTQIVVNFSDYGTTTLEEFKAWLKSKYDAGNPVTIYYKLATPTNLELTTEQKAIRDTKLNTYKNVTNISLSDELASIDVEYKKDLETIINNALATNVAE